MSREMLASASGLTLPETTEEIEVRRMKAERERVKKLMSARSASAQRLGMEMGINLGPGSRAERGSLNLGEGYSERIAFETRQRARAQ